MSKEKKQKEPEKRPVGRPSEFKQETADRICAEIATTSKSLRTILKEDGMPDAATVMRWLRERQEFREQYAQAKEEQADLLAEEIIDIADDGSNDFMTITKGDLQYNVENKEWTSRSRLRVEARKWIASKLKPKKYGEKIDMTTGGEKLPAQPLSDAQVDTILKKLDELAE